MTKFFAVAALALLSTAPALAEEKTATGYVTISATVPRSCMIQNAKVVSGGVQVAVRCTNGTIAQIADNAGHTLEYAGTGLAQTVTLRGATDPKTLVVSY